MPDVLEKVLKENMVDHVAMDVKAPLNEESLKRLTCVDVKVESIKRSIEIIKRSAPSYEFRTTFIHKLLTFEDMFELRKELNVLWQFSGDQIQSIVSIAYTYETDSFTTINTAVEAFSHMYYDLRTWLVYHRLKG